MTIADKLNELNIDGAERFEVDYQSLCFAEFFEDGELYKRVSLFLNETKYKMEDSGNNTNINFAEMFITPDADDPLLTKKARYNVVTNIRIGEINLHRIIDLETNNEVKVLSITKRPNQLNGIIRIYNYEEFATFIKYYRKNACSCCYFNN